MFDWFDKNIFWSAFGGGLGLLAPSFLIYQSKKYLEEKRNFDAFSNNINNTH